MINGAIEFATGAHAGQYRKGPGRVPYVVHPMRVAARVAEYTQAPQVIAAAILHDVVEDTDYTVADIESTFGPYVAGIVEELTNVRSEVVELRAARKARERARLELASDDAQLIKAADRLDNLRDLHEGMTPEYLRLLAAESRQLVAVLDTAPRALREGIVAAALDAERLAGRLERERAA